VNGWSLFSGIGGFDEGLRRAGVSITFQCEGGGDPNGTTAERAQWAQGVYRRAVLATRFPGVDCANDVRDVALQDAREGRLSGDGGSTEPEQSVDRRLGRSEAVDLICGGFPCQDLSVAGRRAGLAGERSGLFFEFARIADAVLAPGGWFLFENVPGLLSSNGGRDFAVILATLAELGFHDLAWRVLDSRHFGVAQRRRRVYLLARRARGQRACEVLLEPEGSAGDPQTRRQAGQGIAPALSGRSPTRLDDQGTGQLVSTLQAHKTDGYRIDAEGASGGHLIADTLTSGSHPASNMPGRWREDDTNIVAQPLRSNPHNNSDPSMEARMHIYGHQGVRRLTPRECERLQGFPDDWTLIPGASDSKRYAALGDAVTVPVAEWIGRRLVAVAAGRSLDTHPSEVA
jgi:DNA (cytosine-5)-methyltransferase 1